MNGEPQSSWSVAVREAAEKWIPALIIVGFVVLFFVLSLLICVLGTYLPLLTGTTPLDLFRAPTECVLRVLGVAIPSLPAEQPAKAMTYADVMGRLFTFVVILFTLILTVVPVFDKIFYRRSLKKQADEYQRALAERQTVEIIPIQTPGEDDIRTLHTLLKDCNRAIIFAGAFDWLLAQHDMRQLVLRLVKQEKLTLVSRHRSKNLVEEALALLKQEDRTLLLSRFVDNSKKQQKLLLTVVWYDGGGCACCSRVPRAPGTADDAQDNLIARSTSHDRQALLDIIVKLTDEAFWRKKWGKEVK